ncbi:hypothetical protein X975_25375, partial [Stegodyphus mimosarum]
MNPTFKDVVESYVHSWLLSPSAHNLSKLTTPLEVTNIIRYLNFKKAPGWIIIHCLPAMLMTRRLPLNPSQQIKQLLKCKITCILLKSGVQIGESRSTQKPTGLGQEVTTVFTGLPQCCPRDYRLSQILFGRDLRLPCDLLFARLPDASSSPEEYIQDLQTRFEVVHNFAQERVSLTTEKLKTRYDMRAT